MHIKFVTCTQITKNNDDSKQPIEIQSKCLIQQTWSFSSGAGEGDFFDSAGLSAPQFCLLHFVLNG